MKDDQFRHFLLSDLFGIQAQVTRPMMVASRGRV